MPKIAIILGDATITGAPIHVLQLSSALKSKGYEVLVVAPYGPVKKMFEERKIAFKEVPMKSPYDRSSANEIRDLVSEFGADIVHFHGTRAGWLGLIGTRKLKVKKI